MALEKNKEMLNLLMAFHAHQPVDNFDNVFDEAFEKSYMPFLNVLALFPEIKISLHISGSLLDWALINKPLFVQNVKKLVQAGQVEIMTAGYYEPILVLIPRWDRLGQIEMHKSKMNSLFNAKPQGLWLTERVWEPSLPVTLKKAGIKFVVVDDEHFKIAGSDPENLSGYYYTEEELNEVAIFPGSKFLRYSLPFKLPAETKNYLKAKLDSGKNCITFGDDLEKFGFWPHTYEWVYEKKWLHNFFEMLCENSSWIKTSHFSDVLERVEPSGRVYLPCASYSEMMEWSSNMFKNFLVKYQESNQLQKRMCWISQSIEENVKKLAAKTEAAKVSLYKAQSNDVYWHGVFGGLYLTHLRYNAYRNLIKAEKALEEVFKPRFPLYEVKDFNLDGKKEVIFKDSVFNIYFSPDAGGSITEIDYKPSEMNLVNVLTRIPEKYHKKICDVKNAVSAGVNSSAGPLSIHDICSNNTEELKNYLIYDSYRKTAWIDHLYAKQDSVLALLSKNKAQEIVNLWDKKYDYEVSGNTLRASLSLEDFKIQKELSTQKDTLGFKYNIQNRLNQEGYFAIEFNLLLNDPKIINSNLKSIKNLVIEDIWYKLKYDIVFSQETLFSAYPLETVSDSESGIEKIYQGISLNFIYPLLKGSMKLEFGIKVAQL